MSVTRHRLRLHRDELPFDGVVELAKRGDDMAVSALYQGHAAMVFGYMRACGAREPDDLTSEVFVGMLRGLARFTGDEGDFRRWLMTIAHGRMVDDRRRQGRNKSHPSEPSSLEAVREGTDHGDLQPLEVDAQLVEAIGHLTDAQREVLALRFIADMSLQGVAIITGRPTGAVKSLQNRGLESLRRQLTARKERLEA